MSEQTLLTERDILIKVHNELVERLVRNKIDVDYFKQEDDFSNSADVKRACRDNRDKAKENIRQIKTTIKIVDDFLSKNEA